MRIIHIIFYTLYVCSLYVCSPYAIAPITTDISCIVESSVAICELDEGVRDSIILDLSHGVDPGLNHGVDPGCICISLGVDSQGLGCLGQFDHHDGHHHSCTPEHHPIYQRIIIYVIVSLSVIVNASLSIIILNLWDYFLHSIIAAESGTGSGILDPIDCACVIPDNNEQQGVCLQHLQLLDHPNTQNVHHPHLGYNCAIEMVQVQQ